MSACTELRRMATAMPRRADVYAFNVRTFRFSTINCSGMTGG